MINIPLHLVLHAYTTRLYGTLMVSSLHNNTSSFIKTPSEINELTKIHIPNLAECALRQVGKLLYGAKIIIMPHDYTKNINESQSAPAITIIKMLANPRANVQIYAPFVPSSTRGLGSVPRSGTSKRRSPWRITRFFSLTTPGCEGSPGVLDGEELFTSGNGIVYFGIER